MIPSSATAVKRNVLIRRERRLPQAGEITVAIGQQVTPVQVVARTSQQRGYAIVPGAELLGVRPEELHDFLLVEEGAAVQRKKPLLDRRSLFGSKRVTSPVNGVLYQVSNGRLILQQTPDLFELRAMLPGIVSDFLGNRGVVIETQGALIEAQWASGREGYGAIKVVGRPDSVLGPEHIGADVRGAVLVVGRIGQLGVLELAEENSVRGLIVGSVPADFVPELPRFRFPILVTEGFGATAMSSPIYNLLEECNGRDATLLGLVRDSWRRPEIVVPKVEADAAHRLSSISERLEVGSQVRLWREPFAGKVGKIVFIHKRSKVTAVGYRLPGVDVALEDGEIVFVPLANLDMIRSSPDHIGGKHV